MLFLTFSRADIWFAKQKFVERIYIAAEALPIIRYVKIIRKREFTIAVLDINNEIFVIYIVALAELIIISIYSFHKV